jgi:hypothetical protein
LNKNIQLETSRIFCNMRIEKNPKLRSKSFSPENAFLHFKHFCTLSGFGPKMIDIGRSHAMLIPNRHIEVADGQISTKCIFLCSAPLTHTISLKWRSGATTHLLCTKERRETRASQMHSRLQHIIYTPIFCVLALSSSIEPGYAVLNVFINAAAET